MIRRLALLGATVLTACAVPAAAASSPVLEATATYQNPPTLPGGGVLGGFSDIYPAGTSGKTFWAITDRGPNNSDGDNPIFVDPTFTPEILLVSRDGSKLTIQQQIPLRTPDGYTDPVTKTRLITGLPNLPTDDAPVDVHGKALPLDPYGVDTEGLVRAPNGTFWISEENRSSVLHVDADGTVLSRLVPSNQTTYQAPGVTVLPILPAIVSTQKPNRGLEGLAISADGNTLYVAQQSPLNNPTTSVSKKSRNLRIYRLDTKKPSVTGEFVNVRDKDNSDDGDWKTSAMVWLSPDRLLIEERDAEQPTVHTLLYAVDFGHATNILGTHWDTSDTPTLEQLGPSDLADNGVVSGKKTLVFDAKKAKLGNGKIEDLALTPDGGKSLLTLINDNDFGVDSITSNGTVKLNKIPTRLDSYQIDTP
ncbi:esterase-like activity of phytase family protein [Fodinicola feengrottensis]|uniref:Esterase-like activity of phytase family protein n=1 Tax=Fodinicola feengrottensis TaxID=435914 RepID=A0ABN2ITV6_9ACTN